MCVCERDWVTLLFSRKLTEHHKPTIMEKIKIIKKKKTKKTPKQIPYDITSMWNLIYGTNEPFHRKETHGLGEQSCGCQGEGGGSGMDRELGVNRCKLLYLEWISNEILLYSIGNYISSHL